jgi:outer membrane protein assembly factor BamB
MRRTGLTVIAVALVVAGCSGAGTRQTGSHAPRPGASRVPVAATRRLAASWSRGLHGGPGGVAADRSGSVVSTGDDTVVAFDDGGRELWSAPVAGAGLGWPVLGGGVVVIPTLRDDPGPGGCVALDRRSGARLWAYEEPDAQGVAVALAGDRVVCALGNGVVAALDRTTGVRRWRSVFVPAAPRSAVSISERTALAVDPATGIVAFAGRVGSAWYVELLDISTGKERGAFDFSTVGPVSAPVETAPGILAVGVSRSREVCALDLRRMRVGACAGAPVPDGFDPASIPLVSGGLIVIAARDGSVTAIDIAAMKVRWSVRVDAPILGARPVAVGGVVMFDDWTRVPWAVHLADGSAVEIPKVQGWVVATVADAHGGFEVAKRDMHGGWIERWVPTSD